MIQAMPRGTDWSEEEVVLAVSDYLDMLLSELRGEPYIKAEHRRILCEHLDGRSKQSVEFKHCNISAWMIENGLPYIQGYKPRGNYQALIGSVAGQLIAARPGLVEEVDAAMEPAPKLSCQLMEVDPPRPFSGSASLPRRIPGARIPDFVALHEQHRALGDQGEEMVIEWERRRLHDGGRRDLAADVRWVAREEGPIAGYDVGSFFLDGKVKKIEVKTTTFGYFYPFFVSAHELDVSRDNKDSYRLYRLFDIKRKPRCYQLEPPIEERCRLSPSMYVARFVENN